MYLVLSAPRYDDVRVYHGRRDVVVEGGLHVAVVLLQHAADVPPPLAKGAYTFDVKKSRQKNRDCVNSARDKVLRP